MSEIIFSKLQEEKTVAAITVNQAADKPTTKSLEGDIKETMFNKNYLLPAQAIKILKDALKKEDLPIETLRLEDCYGRIVASDILSPEDLPPYARSTVDGYAVNAADTFGASENSPAYISVRYEIKMGEVPDFTVKHLEASSIPTGGMLPAGTNAVVMIEHAQNISDDMIEVTRSVAPGENVIQKGEDIKSNEIIFQRGTKLRAQDIGALAGIGLREVVVYRKPRVSVISTGDEIVPHDIPVSFGKIRDINSFTLTGLINDSGGIPLRKGIFKDDYETIKNIMLESLLDSDMVLISGGTSAGVKDMVAMIINDIGTPGVLFHGLSLKPGKPMIGGVVNNKPLLGLPGHPVAVVVCFDLFIRQLIEMLSGLRDNKYPHKIIKAYITKNIASSAGREDHISVVVGERDGRILAHPVLGKSGLISVLAKADGLVTIAHNKMGLDAGDEVIVRLL